RGGSQTAPTVPYQKRDFIFLRFPYEFNKKCFTRYTGHCRGEPLCAPLHTGQAQGPAPTTCIENGEIIFWKILTT
ncbi:MAG: hypothetical protein D3923_20015, partial [Candidatus Electrothrix sp. AR3]|nr:hypothetical protein [Candidatus Electrothrix sp. AR3]